MNIPIQTLRNELSEHLLVLENTYEEYEAQYRNALNIIEDYTPEQRTALGQYVAERFTDPEQEPDPYQRAMLGRIIGLLDMDNRAGIGLNSAGLPEIDWVKIPAGDFSYQGTESVFLPDYAISRYHITYKQFQVFLDADDGFTDSRWWDGLADHKDRHKVQQEKPFQVFRYANHPYDGACWYDAIAFCRWWSNRLGGSYALDEVMEWKVRLPTEQEWEKAATGVTPMRFPWGDEFISGYANFDETDRYDIQNEHNIRSGKIGERYYGAPTAPGIFPQGASPYGVMDMIGTMWDYTLTGYRSKRNDDLDDYYPRTQKGGTWFVSEIYCDIPKRVMCFPNARHNGDPRKNDYSFRVATSLRPDE